MFRMKLNLMMSFSVEVIPWKTKVSTKMFVVRAYFIPGSKILNRNDIKKNHLYIRFSFDSQKL